MCVCTANTHMITYDNITCDLHTQIHIPLNYKLIIFYSLNKACQEATYRISILEPGKNYRLLSEAIT